MASLQNPRLRSYLNALHHAREFAGVHAFHREQAGKLADRRTLERRRQRIASRVQAFPSYAVEALGLSHLHLLLLCPDQRWTRFAYACDGMWGTTDFVQHSLYLHCLVPTEHLAPVQELIHALRDDGWCQDVVAVHSRSGWQHFRNCGHDPLPIAGREPDERRILTTNPLVVPFIAESWDRDTTHAGLWKRMHERLGKNARAYLSNRKPRRVNGKSDVSAAGALLGKKGLFRQVMLREALLERDRVEVVLLDGAPTDQVIELLTALRQTADSVETYPSTDGCTVARATGPTEMLRLIMATVTGTTGAPRIMIADRERTAREEQPRFRYEFLFNPRTGSWVFPRDEILRHMESR
jgi:hypothetical protein